MVDGGDDSGSLTSVSMEERVMKAKATVCSVDHFTLEV
jgi:hypothetical protein